MAPTKPSATPSTTTPRRSRRIARDGPAKLPKTPVLKKRGPSREEELAACANGLEAWLPRLEEDVLARKEHGQRGGGDDDEDDLQRQARKLLDAVQRLQTTRKDLLKMHGWRASKMGDNDDLDHRFLLDLWSCGAVFAKADRAVDEALDKKGLKPLNLLGAKLLNLDGSGNGNGPRNEWQREQEAKGKEGDRRMQAQRALIETLQRRSATGARVRALLPKCPERKARARTYGPSL